MPRFFVPKTKRRAYTGRRYTRAFGKSNTFYRPSGTGRSRVVNALAGAKIRPSGGYGTLKAKKTKVKASPAQIMKINSSKMVDCAHDYAMAQWNPFGDFSASPCVPSVLALPTRKVTYRIRGKMSTGTGGVGFVTLNPYLYAKGPRTNLTNNDAFAPVWHSDSTYDGEAAFQIETANGSGGVRALDTAALPTGWVPAYTDGEWDQQTLGAQQDLDNLGFRVVGAGLRIQYQGKTLNREGQYVLFEDPGNDGYLNQNELDLSDDSLMRLNYVRVASVSDGGQQVLWHPKSQEDLEFSTSWLGSSSDNSRPYDVLAIFVQDADETDNLVFWWEAIIHMELIGGFVTGKTMSHSNIQCICDTLSDRPTRPMVGQENVTFAGHKIAEVTAKAAGTTANSLYSSAIGQLQNYGYKSSTTSGYGPTEYYYTFPFHSRASSPPVIITPTDYGNTMKYGFGSTKTT